MRNGYIYIVKCDLHPMAYKLGHTNSLVNRLKEYNRDAQVHNELLKQYHLDKNNNYINGKWDYVYTKKTNIPSEIVEQYVLSEIQYEHDPLCNSDIVKYGLKEWEYSKFYKAEKEFINAVDKYVNTILKNKNIRDIEILHYIQGKFKIKDSTVIKYCNKYLEYSY